MSLKLCYLSREYSFINVDHIIHCVKQVVKAFFAAATSTKHRRSPASTYAGSLQKLLNDCIEHKQKLESQSRRRSERNYPIQYSSHHPPPAPSNSAMSLSSPGNILAGPTNYNGNGSSSSGSPYMPMGGFNVSPNRRFLSFGQFWTHPFSVFKLFIQPRTKTRFLILEVSPQRFWGFDRRCVGTDSVPSSFSFLTLISSLSAGFFDEFTGGRGEMSDAELLAFLNQPLDSWGDIDSFFCNGNETLGMSILLHLLIQIYQWWKLPWIKESKMVPWEETLAKGGLPSPCLPSSPSLPFDLWMLLFLLSCPSPRLSRKTDLLPSLSGFGLAI